MNKEIDDADPLFVAMMNIYHKNKRSKIETLSTFQSLEEIFTHLANSSPKEREQFLKPWKDKNAKAQAGRKKKNDFEFYKEMHIERHSLETKNGKKFRSWKNFLQSYFKEKYPKMPTEEADGKIHTAENRISAHESRMKKVLSQTKLS
jgi:hypothetical protein